MKFLGSEEERVRRLTQSIRLEEADRSRDLLWKEDLPPTETVIYNANIQIVMILRLLYVEFV